jgi:very-short-patch-repair endonuclease
MSERKMFFGANKDTFRKAFMLRNNETTAESLLWNRLNKNQLHSFRFKRQHPIAYYVADFYCHKAKLIIELDGAYHNRMDRKAYDDSRTEMLEGLGLTVLRFSDDEVLEKIEQVIMKISAVLLSSRALNP